MTGTDREARDIIAASVEAEHDMDAYRQADDLIDALAAAGFEVVSSDLVDACRQLSVPLTKQTLQARAEALQRIRACVAILDGADPTDVFTEGGA